MTKTSILIAGIGNIFFGDDAFGVEVAQRMSGRQLPDGVRVVDFGIRGLDLAYALLDPHDAAILVDAVARGGPPGTLYLIEPDLGPQALPPLTMEPHALDPWKVLALARSLGGIKGRVLLVGCEPTPFDPDEMQMGLSASVEAAVKAAIGMVESLLDKIIRRAPILRDEYVLTPSV